MKMPTFIALVSAALLPATGAFADAPLKLVCKSDTLSAVSALVTLSGDASGDTVEMRVRDNYWHPQALVCSDLAAGKVASTCEGDWYFGADWATFPYAEAELVRGRDGGFAVNWTSNTFGKVVTLPCVAKD